MKRILRWLLGWVMFGVMIMLGVVVGVAVLNLIAKLGGGTFVTSAANKFEDLATPEGGLFAG